MTDAHLDLDALADLLAGEGTEAQVDHVAGCAECAERLAELDEAQVPVAAALAALPAPALPADLADRLLAALDAEGPLPAVEPEGPRGSTPLPPPDEREQLLVPPGSGAAPAGGARTVTPLRRPAPQRRSLPTWLPGAAVVVLVLSAGGLAVSTLAGGSGDDADTTAGAGDSAASAPESASAGVVTNDSGTDYAAAPDAFDRLLPEVLAGEAQSGSIEMSAPAPASSAFSADSGLDRLRAPAALDACLSALVPPDGSAEALAVDYAAYAGEPALVVVLSSSDPSKVDVYVVGPGCAPGNDSTLFFTRVDRPS
jgi:hypothetical protein